MLTLFVSQPNGRYFTTLPQSWQILPDTYYRIWWLFGYLTLMSEQKQMQERTR